MAKPVAAECHPQDCCMPETMQRPHSAYVRSCAQELEPLLTTAAAGSSDRSGVLTVLVNPSDAALCAEHLQKQWVDGKLAMLNGKTCFGYASCKSAETPEPLRWLRDLLLGNERAACQPLYCWATSVPRVNPARRSLVLL